MKYLIVCLLLVAPHVSASEYVCTITLAQKQLDGKFVSRKPPSIEFVSMNSEARKIVNIDEFVVELGKFNLFAELNYFIISVKYNSNEYVSYFQPDAKSPLTSTTYRDNRLVVRCH